MAKTGLYPYDYNKDSEGRLQRVIPAMADYVSGMQAVIGILLSLSVREAIGMGQYIDISMTDTILNFHGLRVATMFQGKTDLRQDIPNPSRRVWQCKDGKWLCTTNAEPHHWANFCRTIDRLDFIPLQFDRERWQEIVRVVTRIFLTKTQDEWLKLFHAEMESQAAPVNSFKEAWQDPHVLARNMVVEVDHPQLGKVKQLGQSIKLEKTPAQIRSLAPHPGQHTDEILAFLGYDAKQICALKEVGAIG